MQGFRHVQTTQANTIRFDTPQRTASWAPVGGGLRRGICAVTNVSLTESQRFWSVHQLEQLGRSTAPGNGDLVILFTAVPAYVCQHATVTDEGLCVSVFATVGLGNRRAFEDAPEWNEEQERDPAAVGTINLVVTVNRSLSDNALMELLAMTASMKTHIVERFQLPSPLSGRISSATGTDCIVVCAPETGEQPLRYAGMHTFLRHTVFRAVAQALTPAVELWIDTHQDEIVRPP